MPKQLPRQARVVIVGGGVIGCSVAYHLAKIGWSDVVLVERKQLTSGTTWHAAGLIGQLRDNADMTRLAQYTADLYLGLEAETGQATGYKRNGSLSIATHAGRMEDLKRRADMARVFGLDVEVIGPAECKARYPLIEVADVVGGIFVPTDGQANPVDVTTALAKGARAGGAQIFEETKVMKILHADGHVAGVATEAGDIAADFVVLAAGMWSRDIAAGLGVSVPLHACEHFYVVTEPFDGVTSDLPVFRDYDAYAYYKEDAGRMLLGAFEPVAKPWGMDGIPDDFCFDQLAYDLDHFQPILEMAIRRMPALETAGIQTFFCGPESFTPDNRYHLGEAPGLKGLFVACGMNSIGVQSAGGVGWALAEWMRDGRPPMDLWTVDVRRNMPFQMDPAYLRERVTESLGRLYAVHWPHVQFRTARGRRLSPLHARLAARGACFGEAAGWERPEWYAPPGVAPEYEPGFGRRNWFDQSAAEHRAAREAVALFDQSSFAKFTLEGRDAAAVLGRVSANDVGVPPGRVVYTQWLNEAGGIEADLTVTRMAEDRFLVVTGAAAQVRHFHWLKDHVPAGSDARLTDVTDDLAVIGVMGPRSRELLQGLTDSPLINSRFPFGHSRELGIEGVRVRASRISYVGELGWELYVPAAAAETVYDAIVAAGDGFGLAHAGYHAMDSLRLEKGYCRWGADVSDQDTPLEAGLGFAVAWDKASGFVGREALVAQRGRAPARRLVQFALDDPAPLLYGKEPVRRDGTIVGYLTSGAYGHTLGRAVGLGTVEDAGGVDAAFVEQGAYEIEVAGVRVAARASLQPFYDPKSSRPRS